MASWKRIENWNDLSPGKNDDSSLEWVGNRQAVVGTVDALARLMRASDAVDEAKAFQRRKRARGPTLVGSFWCSIDDASNKDQWSPDLGQTNILLSASDMAGILRETDRPLAGSDTYPDLPALLQAQNTAMHLVESANECNEFWKDAPEGAFKSHYVLKAALRYFDATRSSEVDVSKEPIKPIEVFCIFTHLAAEYRVGQLHMRMVLSKKNEGILNKAKSSIVRAKKNIAAVEAAGLWKDETDGLLPMETLLNQLATYEKRFKEAEEYIAEHLKEAGAHRPSMRSFIRGPLANAYKYLFGAAPGRSDEGRSGPWSRFGIAFFNAVGCELTSSRVQSALKDIPTRGPD